MVKYPSLFFFGLTGISFPSSPAPGLSVGNNVKLLNERQSIDRLIGGYVDFLGTVELAFMLNRAQAIGYRRSTIESAKDQISETLNGEILRNLMEVNAWLVRLWLIKDNSVNVDSGWMAVIRGQEVQVSNNRYANVVSTAVGKISNTTFSKAELEEAAKLPISPRQWSSGPVPLNIELAQDPEATQLGADKDRFYRFMYFVHVGRTTTDVPIKIAHWCSGLEALVSTSQAELSHQVAERTAAALHPMGRDRLATFRLVKQAYGIRSKAVHGAAFKTKDLPMLLELACVLDDICRRLARLVLENEDFATAIQSETKLYDNYWLSKLLADEAVDGSDIL